MADEKTEKPERPSYRRIHVRLRFAQAWQLVRTAAS
jgi:hypothetical protein